MKEDDSRIPNSLEIAKEKGMKVFFGEANLKEGHPNSVELILTGENGKELEIVGESLGGSRINIAKINNENILVFGDYDADGVCASTVLYKSLRDQSLSFNAEPALNLTDFLAAIVIFSPVEGFTP